MEFFISDLTASQEKLIQEIEENNSTIQELKLFIERIKLEVQTAEKYENGGIPVLVTRIIDIGQEREYQIDSLKKRNSFLESSRKSIEDWEGTVDKISKLNDDLHVRHLTIIGKLKELEEKIQNPAFEYEDVVSPTSIPEDAKTFITEGSLLSSNDIGDIKSVLNVNNIPAEDDKTLPESGIRMDMSSELEEERRANAILNNQLKAAQETALTLRKKIKMANTTPGELQKIADKCRKKNGNLNYSKIGQELGISYHTVKTRCRDLGVI